MKRSVWPAAWPLALIASAPALAKDNVTPLFAESAPVNVEITGPIRTLVREAARTTDPYEATLAAAGETHAIVLSARGLTRRSREICSFPPLSVRFKDKPAKSSLFDGQEKLKLVAHCRNGSGFDQYALKEYAAYRLYNQLTEKSLKVRLARLRYVDNDKLVAERWGFFIEDIDDAARRLGKKQIEDADIPATALDRQDAARYSLFQFMIGNLDWDMTHGPAGKDCCHNSKLLGASSNARETITPVPYDFDYSGLVDAPYAAPPSIVPVRSVTQRYYRGLCSYNDETRRLALAINSTRAALDAELDSIPGLTDRTRTSMKDYLGDFFRDIAKPEYVEENIVKVCR